MYTLTGLGVIGCGSIDHETQPASLTLQPPRFVTQKISDMCAFQLIEHFTPAKKWTSLIMYQASKHSYGSRTALITVWAEALLLVFSGNIQWGVEMEAKAVVTTKAKLKRGE